MKDFIEELRQDLVERCGAELRIEEADFVRQGTQLEIQAEAAQIEALAASLDRLGYTLEAITGVDRPAQGLLEAVYDFNRFPAGGRVTVRVRVPRDRPEIHTISGIFGGADWHEREAHDLFGIVFQGHPDLAPLLLPEDATFHPLRKDFSP